MKMLYFSIIFLLTTPVLLAQKCKWEIDETDSFTGKKHLVCKKELVNQDKHKIGQAQSYATIVLELKEGQFLFNVKHHIGGPALGVDKIVTPQLSLRPATGEIIAIKSSGFFACQLFIGATEIDFQFQLSDTQVKTLSSGMLAFRLSFEGKDYDFTLSDKENQKLSQQFICLSEEISSQ